jgi:hypothetical protein
MNFSSNAARVGARALVAVVAAISISSCSGPPRANVDPCDPTGWCWETEPQPLRGARAVWVASARESWTIVNGAVVRMRDGVATRFSAGPRALPSIVWGAREGEPWIFGGGARRFTGTEFRVELEDSRRVLAGPNGHLWVESAQGFHRWNGSAFDAPIALSNPVCLAPNGDVVERVGDNLMLRAGPSRVMLAAVPLDRSATLFCVGFSIVATFEDRVAMLSMDTRPAIAITPPRNVAAWWSTPHGELFAIDRDRHVFRVGENGQFSAAFDLPAEFTGDIARSFDALDVDPASGVAYVASGSYAYRYERGAWLPRLPNETTVLQWFWGPSGNAPNVVFGSNGWATRAASGQWTFQQYPAELRVVGSMVGVDADNVFLTSSDGALVRWSRASGVTVVDSMAQVRGLLLARNDRDVWAQGARSLRHWDGAAWRDVALPEGQQGVSSLVAADAGSMLAITYQVQPPGIQVGSLYRFDGTTFTPTPAPAPEQGYSTLSAGALLVDDTGALWMRLNRALFVRPRGASEFLRIEAGGAPVEITTMVATTGGVIASREFGIESPDFARVDSATRSVRTVATRPYNRVLSGYNEAIWSVGESQLWIATAHGAVLRTGDR